MTGLFTLEKKTLMFVIRDPSSKTTWEALEADLLQDINKVWNEVKKPQQYYQKPLSDFFAVKLEVLPNFEREEQNFKQQVAGLRKKLFHSIVVNKHAIPGSGIATYAETIWQKIKNNKDLDLPSYSSLVATIRCEQIVKESLALFTEDKEWLFLTKAVHFYEVPNFEKTLNSLVQRCISNYNEKATHYDEKIKINKRKELEANLFKELLPPVKAMLKHIHSKIVKNLKEQLKWASTNVAEFNKFAKERAQEYITYFERTCTALVNANWDFSESRDLLKVEMDSCINEELLPRIKEMVENVRSRTLESFWEQLKVSPTNIAEFKAFAEECAQEHMDYFEKTCTGSAPVNANWHFSESRDWLKVEMVSCINKELLPRIKETVENERYRTLESLRERLKGSPTNIAKFKVFADKCAQEHMAYFERTCTDIAFADWDFSSIKELLKREINVCIKKRKTEVKKKKLVEGAVATSLFVGSLALGSLDVSQLPAIAGVSSLALNEIKELLD